MDEKIDFVITWVNDKDPKWIKKMNLFSKKLQTNRSKDSILRFRDYGTLKFLFRSIERYAPWVNHIYLVTDDQVPNWLNLCNSKVSIVDHKDILPSQILPVFNSDVIELSMNKIKGLSENFVSFNDDMLLNDFVKETDFFINEKPRDFRIYRTFIPSEPFQHIVFNDVALINNWLNGTWPISKTGLFSKKYNKQQIRNIFHLRRKFISSYLDPHIPLCFTKDSFSKSWKIWDKGISMNQHNRFRSNNDISIWLIRYFQLETGNFVPRSVDFGKFYDLNNIEDIVNDLNNSNHKLICINDTYINNYVEVINSILSALYKKYPQKSCFEK